MSRKGPTRQQITGGKLFAYIIATLLFLAGLGALGSNLILTTTYLLSGFLCLPISKKILKDKLNLDLTTGARIWIIIIILTIGTLIALL